MKRTETRELAFRLIYSIEIQKNMDEEQVELFLQENEIEEKAEIKTMLIPYIIGCVVVFGAFTIWKIVVDILQSV